jgi:hypothetical protein
VHRRVQYSKPERAGIVGPPCGLGILDSAGAERGAGIALVMAGVAVHRPPDLEKPNEAQE